MKMTISRMVFEKGLRQGVREFRLFEKAMLSSTFLVFSSLLVSGCGTAGLCVVDVDNASVVYRRKGGTFREAPLCATQEGFMTLQRTETSRFVVRRVGFDGKEMSQTDLPLFTTSYGDESYAFSEGGQRIAYVKWKTDRNPHLVVCSTANVEVNLLPMGMGDNLGEIYECLVLWVNCDLVLVSPQGGEQGGKDPFYLIDIYNKKKTFLCDIMHSYGPKLLSPSKRYLLVSEGNNDSLLYRIHIFDLIAKKKVFEIIPSGKEMHAWGAVWNSDDELVYAVDNLVYAQKIGSTDKREILRLKQCYGAWLYAVDSKHNLHYQIISKEGIGSKRVGGWRTFNIDTKEDKELTEHRINGKVLMTRERDKIVAEVGY
ncbi:MAG: hypothetical protein WCK89_10640 [bacterium]